MLSIRRIVDARTIVLSLPIRLNLSSYASDIQTSWTTHVRRVPPAISKV